MYVSFGACECKCMYALWFAGICERTSLTGMSMSRSCDLIKNLMRVYCFDVCTYVYVYICKYMCICMCSAC